MALVIPDSLLDKIDISANSLLIDFACFLYDKGQLSFGKCRELSGLNHLEFQKELGKRKIYQKYDENDLDTDLKNLGIEL
ncbi:MAG: UPF0175 family protein [Saprospiraceae bacterium]